MGNITQIQKDMAKQMSDVMWDPNLWICYADIMKYAADVLFSRWDANKTGRKSEDIDLDRPATLLYGYAMEIAIKALVLKRGCLAVSGCEKDSALRTHELVRLLRLAEFNCYPEEEMLLQELTQHIIWAGKYPAAFEKQFGRSLETLEVLVPEPIDKEKSCKLEQLFKRIRVEFTAGGLSTQRESSRTG
jgi:hypothetical protein